MSTSSDQSGYQLATTTLQNLVQGFSAIQLTISNALSQYWSNFVAQELAVASTITPDFSTGFNFEVELTENTVLEAPANLKPGQTGAIFISQDATGSRTMTFGAGWLWAGGAAPTLTAAPGGLDILSYRAISATTVVGAMMNDVKA